MKVIGLCGGSGSGKGCVCSILSELGFAIFDTDKIYHDLLESSPELAGELTEAFGRDVLTLGKIDRKKLAAIVFADKSGARLKILNKITHAHILGKVRRGIAEAAGAGAVCAVVDAPVLFESGFDKECDLTLAVVSDKEKRMARIIQRDGIDKDSAERRIDSQISDERLISLCDFVVFNNGDFTDLKREVSKIVSKII